MDTFTVPNHRMLTFAKLIDVRLKIVTDLQVQIASELDSALERLQAADLPGALTLPVGDPGGKQISCWYVATAYDEQVYLTVRGSLMVRRPEPDDKGVLVRMPRTSSDDVFYRIGELTMILAGLSVLGQ